MTPDNPADRPKEEKDVEDLAEVPEEPTRPFTVLEEVGLAYLVE